MKKFKILFGNNAGKTKRETVGEYLEATYGKGLSDQLKGSWPEMWASYSHYGVWVELADSE